MTDEYQITGTYWPCPACHMPIIIGVSMAEQRLTIWGSPERPLFTPHSGACGAKPPYEKSSWGVGPFNVDD